MINTDSDIIEQLLSFEHKQVAKKLRLYSTDEECLSDDLASKTIGLLDTLSRELDSKSRRQVVVLSSILWTYRSQAWEGLEEFLIVVLSRSGFSPSSIIIDDEYDLGSRNYSLPSNSIFNRYSVAVNQLQNEIEIQNKSFLLTDFQKQVWLKLKQVRLLGISAPTSAGKSFIILLKALEQILERPGNIIYIVPTLSLVAQVSSDFKHQLKTFGIEDYRVSTTYNLTDVSDKRIYVLTQEKAISAFSQSETPFSNVRMLIVDEIQNIERVANENDQRAKTLFDTLIEFRYSCKPDITIISGPRIEGLKKLGESIFHEDSTEEQNTTDSPVASFTYAISKKGKQFFLNQYSNILDSHSRLPINGESIEGYGKQVYKDDFIKFLSSVITNLGKDSCNIIFSPTSTQATKTAMGLADCLKTPSLHKDLGSLAEYIHNTVHQDYFLSKTIYKDVAYHHGKMPTHLRSVVEHAIRERIVNNVACTTTLMQGVNLPAQNVIIRNPFLAIKSQNGQKPQLTDYEIANLRGRAGRLLKDFIGRTFVLDESAFERKEENLELFPEAKKELSSGYGEIFHSNESKILLDLEDDTAPSENNREYAFLTTYIRQMILKYGASAIDRMSAVGVEIAMPLFLNIQQSLSELSIPHEICFKNRYWDPLDLEELFKTRGQYSPPSSHSEKDIEKKLQVILFKIRKYYPYYYSRYLDVDNRLIPSMCISAKEWMKETVLSSILSDSYYDSPEKIDRQITLLQNKISYGLPMLLKPLYDILLPDSMFLRFVEMGAYRPITRKMIEMNIPRETAISIHNDFFETVASQEDDDFEGFILGKLRRIYGQLDYWRKVQLQSII